MTEPKPNSGGYPGGHRPKKVAPQPHPIAFTSLPTEPVQTGPIQLEIRVNGKIACMQRVHKYTIDQQHDKLTVTGVLRLPPDEAA